MPYLAPQGPRSDKELGQEPAEAKGTTETRRPGRFRRASVDRYQPPDQFRPPVGKTIRDRRAARLGDNERADHTQRIHHPTDPISLGGIGVVSLRGVRRPSVPERFDYDAAVPMLTEGSDDIAE